MEFGMQNLGTDFRQVSKKHIILLRHDSACCVSVGSDVLWSGRQLEDNANGDHTEITIFKFSTVVNYIKFSEWKQHCQHIVWNEQI
jgi:hypothetical protein